MEIPDEIPTESVTENEKELIHDTRRTQVAKDYNDSGKKQQQRAASSTVTLPMNVSSSLHVRPESNETTPYPINHDQQKYHQHQEYANKPHCH